MALSRLKGIKKTKNTQLKNFKLHAIAVTKNLTEITFERTSANSAALEKAERAIRAAGGYAVITFGTSELTVMTEESSVASVREAVPSEPKVVIPGLVAIGAQFDEKYVPHVGMLYALVQQLAFQNIAIVEFSSTYTELVFYVHAKDMKLAFDTLYEQFM